MKRQINKFPRLEQRGILSPLKNPKDGDEIFSETSVLSGAARYKVPNTSLKGG
jgi:hypothetical protein